MSTISSGCARHRSVHVYISVKGSRVYKPYNVLAVRKYVRASMVSEIDFFWKTFFCKIVFLLNRFSLNRFSLNRFLLNRFLLNRLSTANTQLIKLTSGRSNRETKNQK